VAGKTIDFLRFITIGPFGPAITTHVTVLRNTMPTPLRDTEQLFILK
jgi:hypothetical protein